MAGTASVPNTFVTQSGNVPASQLDDNWAALVNYINPREVTAGTLASRPLAGVSGRWYLATDTGGGTLYVDTGSAWIQAASGVTGGGVSLGRILALKTNLTPIPTL